MISAAAILLAGVILLPAVVVTIGAVPDAAERLALQNSVRTTLVQGAGGLLLLAGAYFTWRQLQLGRDQLRHSLDSRTAELQLNRQGQITEQLSRSIEQLGHNRPSVRVGAIYALEQIAKTSTETREAIHELLAAYIRAEAPWSRHDPSTLTAIEPEPSPDDPAELPLLKVRSADVQAAATVLGRRTEIPGEVIELQSVDLRSVYLGHANLRRAILGRAMLARAGFQDADLSDASLSRVNLRGGWLTNANLRRADLQDANLCGTDFSGADLTDADLRRATCDEVTRWPDNFNWRAAGAVLEGDAATGPADEA